jgi:hypothetical protein
MYRYLAAGAAIYGIGFVAAALERATAVWDQMGTSALVQEAVEHGAVWPSMVIGIFA